MHPVKLWILESCGLFCNCSSVFQLVHSWISCALHNSLRIACMQHCAVWAELYEFHTAQPIQKWCCMKDIAQYCSFDPPTQIQ